MEFNENWKPSNRNFMEINYYPQKGNFRRKLDIFIPFKRFLLYCILELNSYKYVVNIKYILTKNV